MKYRPNYSLLGACLLLATLGCQQTQPDATQAKLAEIDAKIESISTTVQQSRAQITAMGAQSATVRASLDAPLPPRVPLPRPWPAPR